MAKTKNKKISDAVKQAVVKKAMDVAMGKTKRKRRTKKKTGGLLRAGGVTRRGLNYS